LLIQLIANVKLPNYSDSIQFMLARPDYLIWLK
jgi:hypothetical protein